MQTTIRHTVYTFPNAHRNFLAHAKRIAAWVWKEEIKPLRMTGEYRNTMHWTSIYDWANDRVQVAYFYTGERTYFPLPPQFRVGIDVTKEEQRG